MAAISSAKLDAIGIDMILRDRLTPVDYAREMVCVDVLSEALDAKRAGKQIDPLAHHRACRAELDAAIRRGESRWYAKPERRFEAWRRMSSALSSVTVGGEVGVAAGLSASVSLSFAPFDVLNKAIFDPLFFEPAEEKWAADKAAIAERSRTDLLRAAGYLEKRHVMTRALARVDDPEFMTLLDEAMREYTGIDLTDPAARSSGAVAGANPSVATVLNRAELGAPGPDGSREFSPEQIARLESLLGESLRETKESVEGIVRDVAEIARAKGDTLASLREWRESQQRQAEAEVVRQRVEAARSTLYDGRRAALGMAQLLALADPDLGRRAAAVVSGLYAVRDSIMGFAENVTTLGAAGELTKLGTVLGSAALTGNIVGAVLGLVSAFGPSQEDVLLQAVRAIQEQVAQLREEMRDHFRRVDARLDEIYGRLDDGFRRTEQLLQGIGVRVEDVQQQLVDLDHEIDGIAAHLGALQSEAAAMPLLQALNAIHSRRASGSLSEERFRDLEILLHTWCTGHARGALFAGRGPSTALDDLPSLLDGVPPSSNINRLDQALSDLLGDQGFVVPGSDLPNPVVWQMAARAYATLMLTWPHTAVDVLAEQDPERQRQVRDAGREIAVGLARIAVPDHDATFDYTDARDQTDPTAADPAPGLRRMDGLVDLWGTSMTAVVERLAIEQADIVANVRGGTQRSELLNERQLWATLTEPSDGLAAPAELQKLLTGEDLLAIRLGLVSPPRFSCTARWSAVTRTFRNNAAGEPIEHVSGVLTVTCTVAGHRLTAESPRRTSRPFRLPEPGPQMRENWETGDGFRTRFEQQLAFDPSTREPAAPRDDVTAQIRALTIGELAGKVTGPEAEVLLRRTEGARMLLRWIVEVGLPDTVATDETLAEILIRPFDEGGLRDLVVAVLTGPPGPDPFAVLRAGIDRRVAEIRGRLHQHVRRVADGPLEVPEGIVDCLAMLAAAEGILRPVGGTFRPRPAAPAGRIPRSSATDLTLEHERTYEVVAFTDLGDGVDGDTAWFRIRLPGADRLVWAAAATGFFTADGDHPEV